MCIGIGMGVALPMMFVFFVRNLTIHCESEGKRAAIEWIKPFNFAEHILVRRTRMNFIFVGSKNVFMLCWYSCSRKGRKSYKLGQEYVYVFVYVVISVHRKEQPN